MQFLLKNNSTCTYTSKYIFVSLCIIIRNFVKYFENKYLKIYIYINFIQNFIIFGWNTYLTYKIFT